MEAELVLKPLGYSELEFIDLVDRELKGASVSEQEKQYLKESKNRWRSELINYKKKTEMQFSSSSQRSHRLYQQYFNQELTRKEYVDKLNQEKIWRVNAARFLQQIETKLQRMKHES